MNLVGRILRPFRHLITLNSYRAGFLTLLEKPKTKYDLSPVFNLPQRLKGHSRSAKISKTKSRKMRGKCNIQQIKLHNHNGLLKRIRIVGPRHARRFKIMNPEKRHLLRNKSKINLQRKRKPRYIDEVDMERVKKMIPDFKNNKFKWLH